MGKNSLCHMIILKPPKHHSPIQNRKKARENVKRSLLCYSVLVRFVSVEGGWAAHNTPGYQIMQKHNKWGILLLNYKYIVLLWHWEMG